MADVEPREIRWLWRGRIALGRITLVVGIPGCGKSYTTCDWAARISRGTSWPDGAECERGSVLLITAEDDPHDVIRPRLDTHSADVSRVHLLTGVQRTDADGKQREVMFTLQDVKALEDALQKHPDCRMVVIDPIGSFLGGKTDAHRDNEVRSVLSPLARLAEKYGPAMVIIAHRRKSGGNTADETALGSRAFTGIARTVWHVTRDADDPARRLLLPGKNNLAPEGNGLAFRIVGQPVGAIEWEREPVQLTADQAISQEREPPGPEPEARKIAEDWLRELLAGGAVLSTDVQTEAKSAGLKWATVRRAADALRVRREKCAYTKGWQWRFPQLEQVDPNKRNMSN